MLRFILASQNVITERYYLLMVVFLRKKMCNQNLKFNKYFTFLPVYSSLAFTCSDLSVSDEGLSRKALARFKCPFGIFTSLFQTHKINFILRRLQMQ